MKNIRPHWHYALAVILLAVPLLYIHGQFHTCNPFYLNGRQFLTFFLLLMLLINTPILLMRNMMQTAGRTMAAVCLATGCCRLVQGISHHRPVGYLLLLLLLQLLLLGYAAKKVSSR
ncbi:hypothetical protein [Chitinophaga solisilvae]|uniref:hypothetical protein n=1 Tax=Chitinophaga solisilvae TaxID=1233460 RepID=UPI00136FDA23|nr:hypothetical protein [Chitinophaga solisilvae]